MHKIYKAKYFPNIEFLNAKLGYFPSYAWRGIWEAKKSLKMGRRWRVGKGSEISLWINYWVPNHKELIHSVHEVELDVNQKVEYLIDKHTRWWDVEKVNQLFPTTVAAEIFRILISLGDNQDKLIGEPEKSG